MRLENETGDKFRSRLRCWRASEELTLADLADLTGYSKPYLSRVERGERSPSPKAKVTMARRLGVAVRDIFDVEPIADVDELGGGDAG
jgi:transcriptional regulator with XRE-family HTH domain